jgi:ketosteroid isomerase-like protein
VSANLDLVKKGYEDFARGDIGAATEAMPDDFVVEGYIAEGLALSGVHEGKQAVLRALEAMLAPYDEYTFVPDEFVEQGDTIIVLAHTEVRKGDRSLKLPTTAVWRFEDGRPRRQQVLTDTLAVARLLNIV